MKVKFRDVDPELRLMGLLVKTINNTFTMRRLKLMSRFHPKAKSDRHMDLSETWITGQNGSRLRLLIATPKGQTGSLPGLLWLHGGGYAIGAPEMSLFWDRKFIEARPCVVVIPDYRRSFEAPYPAALEDAYEALLWMKTRPDINENQLIVGGDSAGGGLTASLSLYARDKGTVKIAFQMPLYPMLDDRMTTESSIDNNAPVWNSKSNYNAWKLYLGSLFETNDIPKYAAPARAVSYDRLPSTITFVGALEPFRDETVAYVQNLQNAGVDVNYKVFEGAYHAFEQVCPNAKISKQAVDFVLSSYAQSMDAISSKAP